MTVHVVTTCNADGWDRYGRRMVETFEKYWANDINLTLYAEGFSPPQTMEISVRRLPVWFEKWKASLAKEASAHGRDRRKNRRRQEYDYRFDCVRFGHKVAALTDIALDLPDDHIDLLICCDADTLTHRPVEEVWLKELASESYMAWLYRTHSYPECGFMMFNAKHRAHTLFMQRLQHIYRYKNVFMLRETHDSYVIQQIAKHCVEEGLFETPKSLSGRAERTHHPFKYGPLGTRMAHLKGAEKNEMGSRLVSTQ